MRRSAPAPRRFRGRTGGSCSFSLPARLRVGRAALRANQNPRVLGESPRDGRGLKGLSLAQAQGFPGSIRSPTAIDREGVAVDKVAFIRVSKERDGPCN